MYLFAQAAFGIEPTLDHGVRILGFGQVAVGVVGKLLDETVGQNFLKDSSQRIGGVMDGAPKRVSGSGKVATGIVSITPRLPPIVHLFDDTPQGIALQLIGFPPLVSNANKPLFGIIMVLNRMTIRLDTALDLTNTEILQTDFRAIFIHIADEIVFRIIITAYRCSGRQPCGG